MGIYFCAAIFILAGAFTVFCSVMNFDWYMNNRKARRLSAIIGRNGARILYIVIGVIIIIAGIAVMIQTAARS